MAGGEIHMNIAERQKALRCCSALVVKVGTRLLTDASRISPLISQIAWIKKEKGKDVLLVSSGAVGLGMKALGLESRPRSVPEIQALAAVGQSRLMSLYEAECRKHGFHAAQLLLTAGDIRDRERHMNVMNCVRTLWGRGILPVINENDSVSVDELKFGDNDRLAALIAVMMRAGLTVILTSVDGLHSRKDGGFDKRISTVRSITGEIRGMAAGTDDGELSIGGMASKLNAAEIISSAGEYLWIADGRDPESLVKIFRGEDVGTLFLPRSEKQMRSHKRWLSFFSKPAGTVAIDAGAARAVVERGKSLLPSGIREVKGKFARGATVLICDESGTALAKGLSNYSSDEMKLIAGHRSEKIADLIGYQGEDEAVHRDNLVLTRP